MVFQGLRVEGFFLGLWFFGGIFFWFVGFCLCSFLGCLEF
jgi:hypothetical protein